MLRFSAALALLLVSSLSFAAPTKSVVRTRSTSAIGIGYVNWNEKIKLSQATLTDQGVASYSGISFLFSKIWTRHRWQWGITTDYSFGRAASSGFGGYVDFTDGVNRNWQTIGLSPFVYYRFNVNFAFGPGLLIRARGVDWEPADTSVTVVAENYLQYSGTLNMKWNFTPKAALTYSYTPLDFDGDSLWSVSGMWAF